MFPSSGDDLAISHNPDPSSNDVLPTLEGYLYVHSSSIVLEGGRHLNITSPVLQSPDFGLSLLEGPVESVDVDMGLLEVLIGDVHSVAYGGDEAIGHSMCSGGEVFPVFFHAEYHFGGAR